jgi:hypothetical protein
MDRIIAKHKAQKQKRRYFTKDTEDAIVRYNRSTNSKERSDIYEGYIHWPFYKLTENIIHTFKFYNTDVEDLEDLQHEIITFLLSKIHLFDPSKGAKAYSYFGTIVKRYLIVYNEKNYKKLISNLSLSTSDDFNNSEHSNSIQSLPQLSYEEEFEWGDLTFAKFTEKDRLSLFMDYYINYCMDNLNEFFPKQEDAKVADCILELFRKRDNIDIFNKKALYIYIREMMDVKTPQITKNAKVLYSIFEEKYSKFNKMGGFNNI